MAKKIIGQMLQTKERMKLAKLKSITEDKNTTIKSLN